MRAIPWLIRVVLADPASVVAVQAVDLRHQFTGRAERITDPFIWLLMERIFLAVICSSVVLLTTAIGLASPPINYDDLTQRLPLLLRVVPS
jgi:hypothetical protein